MYCRNCGKMIDDNSKFCSSCGKAVENHINFQGQQNHTQQNQYQQAGQPQQNQYNQPNQFQQNQYQQPVSAKKEKKKGKGCLIAGGIVLFLIIALTILLFSCDFEDETDIDGLRDFYTTIEEDGSDTMTVMVYMIGSDLESDGGYASDDISEMVDANFGDDVKLVLMTGGTTSWDNKNISDDTCQYWEIEDGKMVLLEDVGKISMVEEDTLTDFIEYSTDLYPSNRYSLIFWDHGGGTLDGFGYDEYYPDDSLSVAEIGEAIGDSDVKFDFVGFDACLMATIEIAYMLEPYADYMIASQETEPGNGWYYTNWLTNLGDDTSTDTISIGTTIIDDFIDSNEGLFSFESEATLSIIDLRYMPNTYKEMCEYLENATIALEENEYNKIAIARSNAKSFGEGDYEQVDAIDFVEKADLDDSQDVIDAISSSIKYYRNTEYVENAYGLAMYFPYDSPDYYSDMTAILEEVGYTNDYMQFFNNFISAMAGGQIVRSTSPNATSTADFSNEDWYDASFAQMYSDLNEDYVFSELAITEKGDGFVLKLTGEEWEEIIGIELQVMLDNESGYTSLGSDCMYEFDNDGDLKIEFNYTWVALDGEIVSFFHEKEEILDDGSWYSYGYVPALLNGDEYIEVIVKWDSESDDGVVVGYRKATEDGTSPAGKGLLEFKTGDELEWVFYNYTYDYEYEESVILGDTYTVSQNDIIATYEEIEDFDALVNFKLTDIYNNVYESESIIYY